MVERYKRELITEKFERWDCIDENGIKLWFYYNKSDIKKEEYPDGAIYMFDEFGKISSFSKPNLMNLAKFHLLVSLISQTIL